MYHFPLTLLLLLSRCKQLSRQMELEPTRPLPTSFLLLVGVDNKQKECELLKKRIETVNFFKVTFD